MVVGRSLSFSVGVSAFMCFMCLTLAGNVLPGRHILDVISADRGRLGPADADAHTSTGEGRTWHREP
jgi:hypothetical protein